MEPVDRPQEAARARDTGCTPEEGGGPENQEARAAANIRPDIPPEVKVDKACPVACPESVMTSSEVPGALLVQLIWLFVLALPVASIAWTVTHEEILREPREFCALRSQRGTSLLGRKFFYVFTCEYCFSHYVVALVLALTGYRLLLDDWRGYVISFFALAGMANVYLSLFGRLRVEIKSERLDVAAKQEMVPAAEVPR